MEQERIKPLNQKRPTQHSGEGAAQLPARQHAMCSTMTAADKNPFVVAQTLELLGQDTNDAGPTDWNNNTMVEPLATSSEDTVTGILPKHTGVSHTIFSTQHQVQIAGCCLNTGTHTRAVKKQLQVINTTPSPCNIAHQEVTDGI